MPVDRKSMADIMREAMQNAPLTTGTIPYRYNPFSQELAQQNDLNNLFGGGYGRGLGQQTELGNSELYKQYIRALNANPGGNMYRVDPSAPSPEPEKKVEPPKPGNRFANLDFGDEDKG